MTCELSARRATTDVYPVEIEVTSVDGGDVKFDVQVDDTPIRRLTRVRPSRRPEHTEERPARDALGNWRAAVGAH